MSRPGIYCLPGKYVVQPDDEIVREVRRRCGPAKTEGLFVYWQPDPDVQKFVMAVWANRDKRSVAYEVSPPYANISEGWSYMAAYEEFFALKARKSAKRAMQEVFEMAKDHDFDRAAAEEDEQEYQRWFAKKYGK